MRKYPIIICLLVVLFLNAGIQSGNADVTSLSSNHMIKSDSRLFDWVQELQEHAPIVVAADDDFVVQGWEGNGSESNPFIIEEIVIRAPYSAIMISNTTKHFEIRRCLFTTENPPVSGGPALNFRNVTNGRVASCFINGTSYGVVVRNSTDCQFTDNIVSDNMFDAFVFEYGQDILVENNTIHHSSSGISLEESTNFAICDNRIYECYKGMYLIDVQSCDVRENMVWRSNIGIDMTRAQSVITNNTIYGNTNIGVRASTGIASTMVYGNCIGWNGATNAQDDSNSTEWDDGIDTGNCWSDWLGTGNYSIPGTAAGQDRWPLLLVDDVTPVVDSPDDVDFEFGIRGKSVTWNTSDEFPLTYQILRNGEVIEAQTWTGQTLTVQLEGLVPRTHFYMVRLWDAQGNYVTDQVSVIIAEAEPPMINHPPDIQHIVGDVGYNITWIPTDAYPDHYEVFINGTAHESGDWNGSEIVILVDGLDVGVHDYTLVVYDVIGQETMDTVLVVVFAYSNPPPPNYLLQVLFYLGIGAVGFIVAFSILYIRKPFLKHIRDEDDSVDNDEIQEAIKELVADRDMSADFSDSHK